MLSFLLVEKRRNNLHLINMKIILSMFYEVLDINKYSLISPNLALLINPPTCMKQMVEGKFIDVFCSNITPWRKDCVNVKRKIKITPKLVHVKLPFFVDFVKSYVYFKLNFLLLLLFFFVFAEKYMLLWCSVFLLHNDCKCNK